MDNMRNFDIDRILKAAAAEENSALNFEKWKAEILSTAQFLEPATTNFNNKKSARIYEFTRRHGAAIIASAAALLITFGVGSTLLNRKNTAAPESAMPQAAQIEAIDESTPEIFDTATADEYDDRAGSEPFAYSIPEDTPGTGGYDKTSGSSSSGGSGSSGSFGSAAGDEVTGEAPVTPPKTDILPAQDTEGAAVDPGSAQNVTNEVKRNAVDAIINALLLNDLSTHGLNYDNAEIIVTQNNYYTYGPLVTGSQTAPQKTSGEYEGTVFVVSFTLPDWSVKQYVVSTTAYEVLGEVTYG